MGIAMKTKYMIIRLLCLLVLSMPARAMELDSLMQLLDSSRVDYHGNQPQQECGTCHDLAADCIQCHFGSAGSKSPPGSTWPHGLIDNHDDQQQYAQVCIQCHTLTQAYRNEPDDPHCLTCHDD